MFRRATPCLFVLMLMLAGDRLLAAATHVDGRWVFENRVLRVSVAETTGACEVLDRRCGRVWRQANMAKGFVVKGVEPLAAPAQGVGIRLEYARPKNSPLALVIRLSLPSDRADLSCHIAGHAQAEMGDVALPAPFVLDAPEGVLVVPHQSGLLFRVDELEWHGRTLGGMLTMPWCGAADLATGQGHMTILETPDDATLRGVKVPAGNRAVLAAQTVFQAQKGKLGYTRRLLYHFADRGGYVALAKRYRAYAKQKGLVKTLAEKRKERPNIDRLVGAVNIYAGGDFGTMAELKRMGIDRALVSGFGPRHIRKINAWGYLTTRYDIYTDLYEPGTPPSKWERCTGFTFPDDVIKRADGSNQVGWCPVPNTTTGKPDPSYVICWTCGLRTLREKMPRRLAEYPLTAYFLDCTTSARLYECYDPRHPLTRTTDRETRTAQFAYLSQDLGLVVGSEAGRDWAVPVADYFEGIMSTATWFAAPQELHGLPFEPIASNPRYEEYATNPARRVPLFQLVYGDCAETTWWWGDNSHRMLNLWDQKDLLQMIHASMPMWILWTPQQGLFWSNTDRFRECYEHVCRWRRAVGYSEMIGHERLTKDGLVQRSSFANGASVTVNFARAPRRLADGTQLPSRSFLIRGNPGQLPGLPVGKPVQVRADWQPRQRDLTPTGNTGFETRPCFWDAVDGMDLDLEQSVVHGGQWAAKLTGTAAHGWSFASAARVPVQAGRSYTIRGWLRVDALDPQRTAPGFKCEMSRDGKYLTNFFTPTYDLSKLKTWQRLETTFTVPAGATHGRLALERRTTQPVSATLYLDDVELVPAP
jgi:hypothetical protein